MMNYLPQWLEQTHVGPGDTASTYMMRQVGEFIQWAQKHPQKASLMAGDMALTVMLITADKNMVEQFNTQLTGRAYSMAFIAPLGSPTWEEMDLENELRFRALADFSRYAPPMVAAGTNVARHLFEGNFNPVGLLMEAWKGGARATLIQRSNEFIPTKYVDIANAVAGVLAGQSYRQVVETQQNIELTRLAGIARSSISNPVGLIKSVIRSLQIWFHTMTRAPIIEIATRAVVQVLLPAAAATTGIALIAIAILGGPATWFVALGLAFACFAFSGTVAWGSNYILNAVFPQSYQKAIDDVTAADRAKTKAKLMNEEQTRIKRMQEDYIVELKTVRQLPDIRPPKKLSLNVVQTKAAYAIAESMKAKILNKLRGPTSDPVESFNREFKSDVAVKEARRFINEDPVLRLLKQADKEKVAGFLCFKVCDELITEWLNPHLEGRWVEQALNAAESGGDPDEVVEELEDVRRDAVREELMQRGVSSNDADVAVRETEGVLNDNRQMLRRRRTREALMPE